MGVFSESAFCVVINGLPVCQRYMVIFSYESYTTFLQILTEKPDTLQIT